MKNFILLIFSFLSINSMFSQNYQLTPDSCTYCFFRANGSLDSHYMIDPNLDTVIQGNTYLKIPDYNYYFRQVGNKLFCLIPDSAQEYKVMDFDVVAGDTLFDLFSVNSYATRSYNAKVTNVDSLLMSNGSYHNFIELEGLRYRLLSGSSWENVSWSIKWNEKGLCNCGSQFLDNLGGYFFNTPADYQMMDGPYYLNSSYCTTDTIAPPTCNDLGNACYNCNPIASSLKENKQYALELYPNPVASQVNIKSALNIVGAKFSIYNSIGRLSLSGIVTSNSIDVSRLENGHYLLQILSINKSLSAPLIVFH